MIKVAVLKWWNQPLSRRVADTVYIVGSFTGSILIALNVGLNWWGYVFFLSAALSGIWLLRGSNASFSLVLVNIVYAVVNTVGLVRYW